MSRSTWSSSGLRRAAALLGLLAAGVLAQPAAPDPYRFSDADRAFLQGFSVARWPALPPAPSNAQADDPRAAALGRLLFFDTRLSAAGNLSCATCHQPERHFTDGLARAQAAGITRRGAPSLLGAAHGTWLNWDGHADSLWAQALGPIEDAAELAMPRSAYVAALLTGHRAALEAVFGAVDGLPSAERLQAAASPLGDAAAQARWAQFSAAEQAAVNRVFSQAGKALMAYQRRLRLPPAPFDRFVDALGRGDEAAARRLFNADEVAGLRLFMGRANCVSCHNGPLFSNFEFHNVGVPEADVTQVELGRFSGVKRLQADEFSCLSAYSDAAPETCLEMRFLKTEGPELVGAMKTPSLRNVAATAPYMHAGQFATLAEVLGHYSAPKPPYYDPAQHPNRPHFDILPLRLNDDEVRQLTAFLGTLTSPVPGDDPWWQRPGR